MYPRTLALIIAAAFIGAGCASKETKPEPAAAPAAATPAPAATTVASKPECPPEPTAAKKKTAAKSKTASKTTTNTEKKPAEVDCEPAKPKDTAATAKAVEPAPAPAPAKETAKSGEPAKPRIVKSRDGTFEGEVYGNIPPNSKWAKLQIGMEQPEVERILGVSHEVHAYPTAKAFIPFYYGTDRTRYEVRYPGQGSVSYTGGSWGGGRGVVMMINYDPKM